MEPLNAGVMLEVVLPWLIVLAQHWVCRVESPNDLAYWQGFI